MHVYSILLLKSKVCLLYVYIDKKKIISIKMAPARKKISDREKELLFKLILNRKSILENKKTDKISNKQKNESWIKLCEEYNSQSNNKKTVIQLQSIYKNSKKQIRDEIARDRAESLKTGGGPFAGRLEETSTNAELISIIRKTVEPVTGINDSNAAFDEAVNKFALVFSVFFSIVFII